LAGSANAASSNQLPCALHFFNQQQQQQQQQQHSTDSSI
jgi:hypothetical protein